MVRCDKVIDMFQSWKGYKLISKNLGLKWTTLRAISHKWEKTWKSGEPSQCVCGRPTKITPATQQRLLQEVKEGPEQHLNNYSKKDTEQTFLMFSGQLLFHIRPGRFGQFFFHFKSELLNYSGYLCVTVKRWSSKPFYIQYMKYVCIKSKC